MTKNRLFRQALHYIHRSIYLLTAKFSRAGIDSFLKKQVIEMRVGATEFKNILNVGSGGFVSHSLKKLESQEVVNIDIDPCRGPDLVADVCDMNQIECEEFDAVWMVEVLEHVRSPERAISEIHRVLRKGGVLILTSPFIFELHDSPNDFFRFTKFGFEVLLKDFSVVEIKPRNTYLDSIVVLSMRLFVSKYISDKAIALVFIAVILGLYPFIWMLNRLIKSDAATSGFLVRCVK